MKHLRLFEEWNKERFASKEEQRDYYRNLNPISPVEDRTYTPDKLKDFDIPDEIIKEMESWEVIVKSPYSNTFYNSTEIGWNYKPDGSFRVSDHWNFETRGNKHCLTESPVTNTTHVSLGKYDRKEGKYKILLTLPKPSLLKRIELGKTKAEFMKNPEIIAQKKEFKNRIENKEIMAEVTDSGKTYKGIVRKYTGRELKIENEMGELIYNENYLDDQVVKLFDRDGNSVANPFDVKFESKIIRTFEGFFDFFKKKETEDDKIALQFIQRLEKVTGISPYDIDLITYKTLPHWTNEIKKDPNIPEEYFSKIYLVKFDDVQLIITNDRHGIVRNDTGEVVKYKKCINKWKIFIGNDILAERILANDKIRERLFNLVDKIYNQNQELKRIQKIKGELNPEADLLD